MKIKLYIFLLVNFSLLMSACVGIAVGPGGN
jgi:hypothetical protein